MTYSTITGLAIVGAILMNSAAVMPGDRPAAGTPSSTAPVPASNPSTAPATHPTAYSMLREARRIASGTADVRKFGVGRTKVTVETEHALVGTVTITDNYQLPHRLRRDVAGQEPAAAGRGAQKQKATYIWDGEKGYRADGDEPLREVPRTVPAANLFPLPYLYCFDVPEHVPEALVTIRRVQWQEVQALAVHVERGGEWVADLVIDPATTTLVGMRKPLPANLSGGNGDTVSETHFSDFRELHGARLPFTTTNYIAGKRYMTIRVIEFQPLVAIEPGLFPEPTVGKP